jgi:hypothetical protein
VRRFTVQKSPHFAVGDIAKTLQRYLIQLSRVESQSKDLITGMQVRLYFYAIQDQNL